MNAMERLLEIALTNASGAFVLAGVAAVAERTLRRPEVTRALWLLVLVRLLVPPVFELGLPVLPDPGSASAVQALKGPALMAQAASLPERGRSDVSPAGAACLLWLAGTAAVLALASVRISRFRTRLAGAEPAGEQLAGRVRALAGRMGIARPPEAVVLWAEVSPMLWAVFGSRRLVMPSALLERLSQEETDALLVHELAHLKRRDHWVRFLELVAVSLFWWHPVAWWARRRLRGAEELCCDVLVARTLPERRRAYADGLLKTMTYLAGTRSASCAVASGLGEVQHLEGRLTMIMTKNLPKRLSKVSRTALAVVALLSLAVYPTLAQKGSDAGSEPGTQDLALGQVLGKLAAISSMNVIVEPGTDLSVPVTADWKGLPWEKAFDEVLDAAGIGHSREGNVLWILGAGSHRAPSGPYKGQPINLNLEDADLRASLDELSKRVGFEIDLDPRISGRLTIQLIDVPWDQAFEAILWINGLEFAREDGVVRIRPVRQEP